MRSILNLPARRAWIGIAVVFVAGVVVGTALTLPSEAAVQAPERTFSSPAGLLFNPCPRVQLAEVLVSSPKISPFGNYHQMGRPSGV